MVITRARQSGYWAMNGNRIVQAVEHRVLLGFKQTVLLTILIAGASPLGLAQNLDVTSDMTLGGGTHEFGTVTVHSGATLTLDSASSKSAVLLSAATVTVETGGAICADGKGYPLGLGPNPAGGDDVATFDGASHGGRGMPIGKPPTAPDLAHETYGSACMPDTLGASSSDAMGGGAIHLEVASTLTVAGVVCANGQSGSSGGAGGSIFVVAGQIAGRGALLADGGTGTSYGGGGGRIAVHYGTSSFSGTAWARGGAGATGSAENGTVGWFREGATTELFAGHSWRFQENDAPFRYDNIQLTDASVGVESGAGAIIALNRFAVTRSAADKISRLSCYPPYAEEYSGYVPGTIVVSAKTIDIDDGCEIDVTGRGYRADVSGPGGPTEGPSSEGGAGHGGKGAGMGGLTYGNATLPTDLGSCAVTYFHYNWNTYLVYTNAGGGAIHLKAKDDLVLHGNLLANGYSAPLSLDTYQTALGGNAGGSILVEAGALSGSGNIEARGSRGNWGGGGGRIAIHYGTSTYSGTATAAGGESIPPPGLGRAPGVDGTVTRVKQTVISPGGGYDSDITGTTSETFKLEWPGGRGTLLLRLIPESMPGAWRMLGAYDRVPLERDYDWTSIGPTLDEPAAIEMFASLDAPGSYVFAPLTTSPDAHFKLECSLVQRYLSHVNLGVGGTGGSTTVHLAGAGLAGTVIELRNSLGAVLGTFAPSESSPVGASVVFGLRGILPQVLTVAVLWAGGPTIVLPDAFTVTSAQPPTLAGKMDITGQVRRLRPSTFWVEVVNKGTSDLPAPILRVDNDQGLPMRLSSDDPYEYGALLLLGLNDKEPFTTLPPGARVRFPVQYIPVGAFHSTPQFTVDKMTETSEAVDWAGIEEQARPSDISDSAWNVIWSHFTSQIGGTWAAFANRMRQDAAYLAQHGQITQDVNKLFALEMSMASGATGVRQPLEWEVDAQSFAEGLGLSFARFATNTIDTRSELSEMGRGWTHSFAYWLEFHDAATIIVHGPGGLTRRFVESPTGRWQPDTGDFGSLTELSGQYTLKDPGGLVWQFDADGRLLSMADMHGNAIACGYSGDLLSTLTHSNGDVFTLGYSSGRIATLTDHAGRTVSYAYTGDLLTSVTTPPGDRTVYEYEPQGTPYQYAISRIVYPHLVSKSFSYDNQGRLASESGSGDIPQYDYSYPSIGRMVVNNGSTGSAVEMAFDGTERLLQFYSPLGRSLAFEYTTNGAMAGLRLPDGARVIAEHDAQGNTISSKDPLGSETTSSCNALIRAFNWVRDPLGRMTAFGHTNGGGLKWITYPDGSRVALNNDTMGNATQMITRRGSIVNYVRNARGLVTEKNVDGVVTTYSYDSVGRPQVISNASGDIVMAFDDADRLRRIDYPDGHCFSYNYNGAGQRVSRIGDDGFTIQYIYDAAGRLFEVRDGANDLMVRYGYDSFGLVSQETRGNGTYTEFDHDSDGRLMAVNHHAPDGQVQGSFAYTYNANGRRTSMTTLSGRVESYTYDASGRLTAVDYGDGTAESFVYDEVGNRVSSTASGSTVSYAVNDLNQYLVAGEVTQSFDVGGNLARRQSTGGSTVFEYDAEDRLKRVTGPTGKVWTIAYDGLGNRSSISSSDGTVRFLYDPGSPTDLAATYDGSGALTARFVVGKSLVARLDSVDGNVYYGFDGIGNTRLLTNDEGDLVGTEDYAVFGSSRGHTGSVVTPFKYGGAHGALQEPFGLVRMRARDYEPTQGRFTTPDPIDLAGGINLYAYAFNDPVNRNDPTGLTVVQVFGLHFEVGLKDEELKKLRESRGQDLKHYGASGDMGSLRLNTVDEINTTIPQAATDTGVEIATSTLKICTGAKAVDVVRDTVTSPAKKQATTSITKQLSQWWKKKVAPAIKGLQKKVTDPVKPPATWSVVVLGNTEIIGPADPNEKVGTLGVGTERRVRLTDYLDYTIYFENKSDASAPAQEVFVSDVLSSYLDASTVEFTEIAWGDRVMQLTPGARSIASRESIADYRAANGSQWFVNVSAQVDQGTRHVSWALRTLDPETLDLPEDPQAGFLPVNDDSHRGEGHVSFRVKPRADAGIGVVIRNKARIVFDSEAAIETNEVTNKTAVIYRVDVDASGNVNAIDIQNVVNAVLGVAVGFDCDVNGDGSTNAIDVQLVVNGALGLLSE